MSNSIDGDARDPEDDLKISSTEACRDKELFFSFRISQQASIFILECRCSLLVRTDVIKHLKPASVIPTRSVNLETVKVLELGLGLRFLSFFKCAWLPNISHVAEREFLFEGVEQLEDIFSILRTNLRTSLSVLGWGK